MKFFEKNIIAHFQSNRRNLPWRKKNITAYEVWVSEIMLQQTQVSRVIDYYEKFLLKFPTVVDLAKATWEDFLPYYAGLGYYRRGRNMLKTAQTVVQDFEREFPRDKKQLMSLPGIGEYTASAILTFAYGENHLAFDTNLQKVFGRFLHGNKRANVDREALENKLTTNKGDLSAAIMDFANQQCLSKPKCNNCPLKSRCHYAKTDGRLETSPRSIKNNFPTKDAVVFLWLHKEHKEYYSPNADRFEVFKMPIGVRSRDEIKKYFRDHFGLELAVRPPHKKTFMDDVPVLFVNAQILLGEHDFAAFKPSDIENIIFQ